MTGKKATTAPRAIPQHVMRRKLFALFYLGEANGNGTLAAQMAGFSERTAYAKANTLLKEPDVIAEIDRVRGSIIAKAEALAVIDKARVLKELEHIGFSDPAAWFDPDNTVRHIREMPEDARRALKSVKVKRDGRGRSAISETVEFAFWPKIEALVNLGKELGMFVNKVEVKNTTLEDLIRDATTEEEDALFV
jgi:hypothetical protein